MDYPEPLVGEDEIRQRSYEIWQREGHPSGMDAAHWFRAKAELEAEALLERAPILPMTFVMPRVPISMRPNRRIAHRISRAEI